MSDKKQQRDHSSGSSIPGPLRERSQWIVTKEKQPIKPASGWNKLGNQLGFNQAQQFADQYDGEVAYVLHADDPFVIVDIDDVGAASLKEVRDEIKEIIHQAKTYTEASRSRTGHHLVFRGNKIPERCETGSLDGKGKLEVFDQNQCVVLTGDQIGPYDTVVDGHSVGNEDEDILSNLQQRYLPKQTASSTTMTEECSSTNDYQASCPTGVRTQDIRRTLEEYAKAGHSKAQRALDRWDSPAGSDLGFKSPSEADLALAADLAFWCRGDRQLIHDCLRDSSRARSKWQETHYSDGKTYLEGLVETVANNHDVFSGNYVQHR